MSGFELATKIAIARIHEIAANGRIRQNYHDIVVSQAQTLYSALSAGHMRGMLQKALADKDADPSPLYRGLIVQVNGVFEQFVHQLVGAALMERKAQVQRYSELQEPFRQEHLVKSARILSNLSAGNVNGRAYDFRKLQNNLGLCLTDDPSFELNNDVYVLQLGNCKSKKLEALFDELGLPAPFDTLLSNSKEVRSWARETKKVRILKRVRDELDRQIDLRNELAHGTMTKPIVPADLDTAASFYKALIPALESVVKAGFAQETS